MEINIEELSLEEKIGQMLIIGMDTNYITDRIKNMIQKYKIGGIILYRKNFKSYDSMVKLINELKELNKNNKIPMFIAIDQEGGRVNRMPKGISFRWPCPRAWAPSRAYWSSWRWRIT